MKPEEAIEKYNNFLKKENHIIDGYDTDKNIIVDKQALKTIENILEHKNIVKERMIFLAKEIENRASKHDNSKLKSPEIEWLIQMDKEPKVKYGTKQYFEKQKRWNKFFKHHYENNRHHPDYFKEEGVNGMTIVDLVEMMCDIVSYREELHVTDVYKILDEQKERFKIGDNIIQILINTLNYYYAWVGNYKPKIEVQKALKDMLWGNKFPK